MCLHPLWGPSVDAKQNFVLHWRDHGTGKFSSTYINVDGRKHPGRCLNGLGESKRSGARLSANTEAPFTFMEIPFGRESTTFILLTEK